MSTFDLGELWTSVQPLLLPILGGLGAYLGGAINERRKAIEPKRVELLIADIECLEKARIFIRNVVDNSSAGGFFIGRKQVRVGGPDKDFVKIDFERFKFDFSEKLKDVATILPPQELSKISQEVENAQTLTGLVKARVSFEESAISKLRAIRKKLKLS